MLPTFVVIGAMKAGTTSLYDYLAAHPQVFMATPKELHFFPLVKNWDRGQAWYEAKFDPAGDALARGEVSPSYSQADVFPGCAARIAAMVPEARIVYLVREPIARMQSMYLHQVANGRERRPIEQAFREDGEYLSASRYAYQLDHYLEHFARDRVHVLTTEALRDQRADTLAALYRFVGVDPAVPAAALAGERGRTDDKRMARPGVARAKDVTVVRRALQLVPEPVRRALRPLTRTRVAGNVDTTLPPDLHDELRRALAPDVARLRDLLPPQWDGWGIA